MGALRTASESFVYLLYFLLLVSRRVTSKPCLISGGWPLVSSVVLKSSSPPYQLPVKTSYRVISSTHMLLKKSALTELRIYLNFPQLRFNCRKQKASHSTSPRLLTVLVKLWSSTLAVRRMFSLTHVVRLS